MHEIEREAIKKGRQRHINPAEALLSRLWVLFNEVCGRWKVKLQIKIDKNINKQWDASESGSAGSWVTSRMTSVDFLIWAKKVN